MKPKLTLPPRYYLLLTVLYTYIPAQAQKPHIGVKLGMAFSNVSIRAVDPIVETNTKTSVTFGFFVHIPVKGRFSIRPSMEYVSKGALSKQTIAYSYRNPEKIQLEYLDVPLNFLHEFHLKKNKVIVGGGPVISVLLTKHPYEDYAGNDIGVNILAGYEWEIGASLSLNFTQGLKNIVADRKNGGNIQNHYFGFTIGYWF